MAVSVMIDNVNISTYNADLVDFLVTQNELTENVLTTKYSYKPVPLKGNKGTKKITMTLDISDGVGVNNNAFHKISDLVGYLVGRNEAGEYIELDIGDGFGYKCCFVNASDPQRQAPWIQQIILNFVGFRHRTKISKTFTAKHYCTVSSAPHCDLPSPIKIKFTPPTGTTAFCLTVGEVRIYCTNISNYIQIDTLHGTIKDSIGNAFHKTDLKEFPYFQGNSEFVTMSHNYARTAYVDGDTEVEVLPVCY